MEFLTAGDKIKRMRSYLDVKQKDLHDEKLTRAYLSMIEINKRAVTKDISWNLFEKFNKIAMQKGKEISIDGDYFYRQPKDDARLFCVNKIKELYKDLASTDHSEIKEISAIGSSYDLKDVIAEVNCLYGDKLFIERRYSEAISHFVRALDFYMKLGDNKKNGEIYFKLGYADLNQHRYSEAINYYKLSEYYARTMSDESLIAKCIYNIALCYRKLGFYDYSLQYANKYIEEYGSEFSLNIYSYCIILKAICLEKKEQCQDAISELELIVKKHKDLEKEILGIIYTNLGQLYLKKNEFLFSESCFNQAIKYRKSINSENLYRTIIERAKLDIQKNFFDQAVTSLVMGTDIALQNMDMDFYIMGIILLCECYQNQSENWKIIDAYTAAISLLKKTEYPTYRNDIIKFYTKLANIYLQENDLMLLAACLVELDEITAQ